MFFERGRVRRGDTHEDRVDQNLGRGDARALCAGQFGHHAALRPANLLQVGLRLGTLKSYAGLGLLSYRRIFEDECIFREAAARLGESCGNQQ